MKELDLQDYIWKNRSNWKNLLEPINLSLQEEDPYEGPFPDPENPEEMLPAMHTDRDPQWLLLNLVKKKIMDGYSLVENMNFIGKEVRLKKLNESTIRADFIAYSHGRTGLTIVELKTSKKTSRESLTELLAYGNHLKTSLPGTGLDNIFFLLVAPMQERIVKEALISTLLSDEKAILALEPVYAEDNKVTFKPWFPSFDDIHLYSRDFFHSENIDIVKIMWEEVVDYWNPDIAADSSLYIDNMNTVSSYCAQLMEAKQISGFTYASQGQRHPDRRPENLLNELIIAGINPYKAKYKEGQALLDIIPDLQKHLAEVTELGEIHNILTESWNNNLEVIGKEIVEFMTTNLSKKIYKIKIVKSDWEGHFDLYSYGINLNFRVFSTGVLRKLYFEQLKDDYRFMQKYGTEGHLQWNHGDVSEFIVDHFQYHEKFLDFIQRFAQSLRRLSLASPAEYDYVKSFGSSLPATP